MGNAASQLANFNRPSNEPAPPDIREHEDLIAVDRPDDRQLSQERQQSSTSDSRSRITEWPSSSRVSSSPSRHAHSDYTPVPSSARTSSGSSLSFNWAEDLLYQEFGRDRSARRSLRSEFRARREPSFETYVRNARANAPPPGAPSSPPSSPPRPRRSLHRPSQDRESSLPDYESDGWAGDSNDPMTQIFRDERDRRQAERMRREAGENQSDEDDVGRRSGDDDEECDEGNDDSDSDRPQFVAGDDESGEDDDSLIELGEDQDESDEWEDGQEQDEEDEEGDPCREVRRERDHLRNELALVEEDLQRAQAEVDWWTEAYNQAADRAIAARETNQRLRRVITRTGLDSSPSSRRSSQSQGSRPPSRSGSQRSSPPQQSRSQSSSDRRSTRSHRTPTINSSGSQGPRADSTPAPNPRRRVRELVAVVPSPPGSELLALFYPERANATRRMNTRSQARRGRSPPRALWSPQRSTTPEHSGPRQSATTRAAGVTKPAPKKRKGRKR